MTISPGYAGALLTAANIVVLTFLRLRQMDRVRRRRVAALHEAAEALRIHAETLERFLDAPDAPGELKAMLIGFSDAMADPSISAAVARAARAGQPYPDPSGTTAWLIERVERLRDRDPGLAETFERSVGSAILAAFRALPDSSELLEALAARVVVNRGAESSVVAQAAELRSAYRSAPKRAPVAA